MQLTEAATLDRKSGEAEGSAVRHSGAPNLSFYNFFPLSSCLPRRAVGAKRLADLSQTEGFKRAVKGPRRCLLADALRSFPAANYTGRKKVTNFKPSETLSP